MKSLQRQANRCDRESNDAYKKAKRAYATNNFDAARVHAETTLRHRNQSRYYQMLSARLTPMVDQLKSELSGGPSMLLNLNEMQEIVQNINRIEQHQQQQQDNATKLLTTQIELSSNDVDSLMQQLNDEIALDVAQRLPMAVGGISQQAQGPLPTMSSSTNDSQSELEQRLANLRRRQ